MASLHFPADLIDLEVDSIRTYTDLARQPAQASTTTLRRRLITLSCAIAAHPFWQVPGRSPAARVELRRRARARSWTTAA